MAIINGIILFKLEVEQMVLPVDYKFKGSLSIEGIAENARLVFPGVRGEIRKPLKIDENTVLPIGTKVIIQPLNRHLPHETPRFKLTVYERVTSKRKDLPEDQRNITTKESYEVELAKPLNFLNYNEEQYERTSDVLFKEGSPSIDDVNQSRVPNCFFLAALSKVVHHPDGPAYIRSMMRQNDDGTTTVRLFNPKTLEPIYVRVENSYIVDQWGSLNRHTALWVHILEKAYASIPELLDKNDASMSSVYTGGGNEKTALAALTGLKVNSHFIANDEFQAWDVPNFFNKEIGQIEPLLEIANELPHLEAIIQGTLIGKMKVFKEQFGEAEAYARCMELLNFYMEHKDEWVRYVGDETENAQKLANIVTFVNECIHQQSDQKKGNLDLHRLKDTLTQLFIYYFVPVSENVVRGDREIFSGNYSPTDLQHYERIKAALTEGKLVTAGTLSDFKDVKGIRAKHAYTVLDVIEKQVPNAKGEIKNVYFVRLRNPWGSTGRLYLPDTDTLEIRVEESRGAAIFDLELKDFCRYYSNYDITACSNPLFSIPAQKETLNERLVNVLEQWNIHNQSSHYELQEAVDKYRHCVNSLIAIELSQLDLIDEEQRSAINDILKGSSIVSEEEKKEKILEQINPARFPYIQGDAAQIKNHVYELLIYQWHRQNNSLTQEQIIDFEDRLIKKASIDNPLWKQLRENHQHLHVIVTHNIQYILPAILREGSSLLEVMNTQREQIPEKDSGMYRFYLEAYFLNYQKLLHYVRGFSEYQNLLKRLHLSFQNDEMEIFNEKIQDMIRKTEDLKAISEDVKKIAKETREIAYSDSHENDYWQMDSEAIKHLDNKLDALGLEAKKYQPVDEVEVKEKEHFFRLLDSIANLFKNFATLFEKLHRKPQNDYEKIAEKDKEARPINPGKVAGIFVPIQQNADAQLKSAFDDSQPVSSPAA
ncbi:C2 family cysteine protease [Legionella israelensis]|nr:C2 family cysteine protease [Legionella israelensis]